MNFSALVNMAGSGDVEMKCFTELRDNQKIDSAHTGYFGEYGIAMKPDWASRNGAGQVIYVNPESFLTTALGRLSAIYNSSAHFGKGGGKWSFHALRAFFDVWSFFEVSEHRYEYEWRILGKSSFVGNPEGFEVRPSTIGFSLRDMLGLFVPRSDLDHFRRVLEDKAKVESVSPSLIPPVREVGSVLLSDAERSAVADIFRRDPLA